jgi:hypothetical protein
VPCEQGLASSLGVVGLGEAVDVPPLVFMKEPRSRYALRRICSVDDSEAGCMLGLPVDSYRYRRGFSAVPAKPLVVGPGGLESPTKRL